MKNIHTYTNTHTHIHILLLRRHHHHHQHYTTTKIHRDEFGIDVEQLEIMQGALDLKKIKTTYLQYFFDTRF